MTRNSIDVLKRAKGVKADSIASVLTTVHPQIGQMYDLEKAYFGNNSVELSAYYVQLKVMVNNDVMVDYVQRYLDAIYNHKREVEKMSKLLPIVTNSQILDHDICRMHMTEVRGFVYYKAFKADDYRFGSEEFFEGLKDQAIFHYVRNSRYLPEHWTCMWRGKSSLYPMDEYAVREMILEQWVMAMADKVDINAHLASYLPSVSLHADSRRLCIELLETECVRKKLLSSMTLEALSDWVEGGEG